MRVLVLTTCTPDDRKTLAAVRALGREGWEVHVAGDRHMGMAYYSRYCKKRILLPHPLKGLPRFIEELELAILKYDYSVLLPMNDYTVLALAQAGDNLSEAVSIPIPTQAKLNLAKDKDQLLECARRLGVGVPNSMLVRDKRELDLAIDRIGYPCVVKLNRGAGSVGMTVLRNTEDYQTTAYFEDKSVDYVFDHDTLLVQEFIPGDIHSACLMFAHGKPVGGITQRQIRKYPPRIGPTVIAEATDMPDVLDCGVALLEALEWHGPAEVEFKLDARDGSLRLLEINGRFWGSLDLAIQAGINLPSLACQIAQGADVEPSFNSVTGLRYRWPLPFGLLTLLRDGERAAVLRDFFFPAKDTLSDLWLSDPLPTLAEIVYIVYRTARRGFRISQKPVVSIES